MSQILAARFPTFAAAETTKGHLLDNGFVEEDIVSFYVNPSGQHARFPVGGDEYADPQARPAGIGATGGVAMGAVAGVIVAGALSLALFHSVLLLAVAIAVGAYVGSLAGAMFATRGGGKPATTIPPHAPHERESGVLLAVHVTAALKPSAVAVLRDAHGTDIEEASGLWQDGHWADFDPTRMVKPLDDLHADVANPPATMRKDQPGTQLE